MSVEEARRIILSDMKMGTKETADALCVAVDALDKVIKYRWHDLRKNPEDLPAHGERKLAVTETKTGKKNYVLAYYHHGLREWAAGMNSNVIAWMDIPVLEEES